MKRTALLLALAALLFLAPTARAAEGGPRLGLTPGKTLIGRFVHEHPVQGFDKPITTEGRFSLAPGDKMLWIIEKPMATTTTVTPEGLVQSVGNFPLLKLTAQQMPFLAEAEAKLIAALNGDWKTLDPDFIVVREGTPQKWTVTLTPREQTGSAKPFQKIVARGGAFPESAEIVLKTVTDRLTFSDQQVIKTR